MNAADLLDRYYLEMRARVLALAADFDRLERSVGGEALVRDDPRLTDLRACLAVVSSTDADRAARVQSILSDKTSGPA